MISQRIVAIGGGGIGQPGRKAETTAIDREIVRLTGKARPRVLFVPTASGDDPGYAASFRRHYGGRLGCRVEVLNLVRARPRAKEIARLIGAADAVYVGGGNTLKMVTLWKRLGVDRLLAAARRRGAVLCGLSAGSICWFRWGNSDSRKKHEHDKTLIRVSALGYLPALNCPHYDGEDHRPASLRAMMRRTPGVAVAAEDCAAFEVVGNRWRVVLSKKGKRVFRIGWKRGRYFKEALPDDGAFRPLAPLLSK